MSCFCTINSSSTDMKWSSSLSKISSTASSEPMLSVVPSGCSSSSKRLQKRFKSSSSITSVHSTVQIFILCKIMHTLVMWITSSQSQRRFTRRIVISLSCKAPKYCWIALQMDYCCTVCASSYFFCACCNDFAKIGQLGLIASASRYYRNHFTPSSNVLNPTTNMKLNRLQRMSCTKEEKDKTVRWFSVPARPSTNSIYRGKDHTKHPQQ